LNEGRPNLARHAAELRRLHAEFLILPNAWDAPSARRFADLGFPALATTSSGVAATLGYEDREQMPAAQAFLAVSEITRAVDVPVTADLEAGYRLPADELVDRLLEAGACGLNLEDSDHHTDALLIDAEGHAGRLADVKAAARQRGVDVFLNARVDVHLRQVGEGKQRLHEALRRARLYAAAGADCIYPIGVSDEPTIASFVAELDGPVNVLYSAAGSSLARLRELGVRRVTFGGSLQRIGIDRSAQLLDRIRSAARTYPWSPA
jgi:2-methylisocitrate lyase-like PEP mutase family enzyme